MRYIITFVLGGAAVFAMFILFPWMKQNLEFSPQFHIDGGSGELASDGGKNDNGSTKAAASRPTVSQEELQAELDAIESRKEALRSKERLLATTQTQIEEQRGFIDGIKAEVESQLLDTLNEQSLSDGTQRAKRRLQAIAKASPEERRRLMFEAYQQMSPEGLAQVVQDLAKERRTDSAVSVLSILEDRKAARVLALVAEPQPALAASLTTQLRDGSIRFR